MAREGERAASGDASPSTDGRHLLLVGVGVVLLLTIVGLVVVWDAYRHDVARTEDRAARAADSAMDALDQFIAGRVAMLESVSRLPGVRALDLAVMADELAVMSNEDVGFAGGVGWIDAAGQLHLEAGTSPEDLPLDLTDRAYVQAVLAAQSPVVSDGLRGRISGDEIFVLAVPTFDAEGDLTGAVIASLLLRRLDEIVPSLDLRGEVLLVDASGKVIFDSGEAGSFEPVALPALADRGMSLATGPFSHWTVAYDADDSALVASARRDLLLEVSLIGVLAVAVVGCSVVAMRRVEAGNRQMLRRTQDLIVLERLTEGLARAGDRRAVAKATIRVLTAELGASEVVVGVAEADPERFSVFTVSDEDDPGEVRVSPLPVEPRSLLVDAYRTGETLVVDDAEVRRRYGGGPPGPSWSVARRFRSRNAGGAVRITLAGDVRPPTEVIELFEAMVPLLGDAFGRAAAMERERSASRTLQRALLPLDRLEEGIPLQRATRYQPATDDANVGGDWFDLFPAGPGRVGVAVGDIVGQGMPAAAVMGQLQSALRAFVSVSQDPAEAIDRLDAFSRDVPGAMGATVVLGMLELDSGRFAVTAAGHPPPVVVRDGRATVAFEVRGMPLGIPGPARPRQSATFTLAPEDGVLLYTDGLVERRGEVLDEGLERLAAAMERYQHLPVERLADALLAACLRREQPDDVALVCLRPVGALPRTFTVWLRSDLAELRRLREALRAWLEGHGVAGTVVDDALLATSEAAANAAEHGYRHTTDGDIVVEVERTAAGLEVSVRDWGHWSPPAVRTDRGRGLKIIERVSARLVVDRMAEGTTVRFLISALDGEQVLGVGDLEEAGQHR